MCQRKTEFFPQILICLKLSLIHVHVRNDSMVIEQLPMYIAPYVKNISIKSQYLTILFNFTKLYYYCIIIFYFIFFFFCSVTIFHLISN